MLCVLSRLRELPDEELSGGGEDPCASDFFPSSKTFPLVIFCQQSKVVWPIRLTAYIIPKALTFRRLHAQQRLPDTGRVPIIAIRGPEALTMIYLERGVRGCLKKH